MTDHDRMEQSGLLGASFSAAARVAWPRWAAQHFDECAECQALLRADAVLQAVVRRGVPASGPSRPLDVPATLPRDGGHGRTALGASLAFLRPFPAATFRDNPLQLAPTATGIRVIDPAAAQVSLFRVRPGSSVRHLATSLRAGQGCVLEATLALDEPVELVAVGVAEEVEPGFLETWLHDVLAAGVPAGWDAVAAPGRVHARATRLSPVEQRLPLRLRATPCPPSSARVATAVDAAVQAGMAGDVRRAATLFAAARDVANREGDEDASARCTLGIANAMLSIGLHGDSGRVLDELVATTEFTAPRAAQASRAQAVRALLADDAELAHRWLAEAEKLEPGCSWNPPVEWAVAGWRRDAAATLDAARRDDQPPTAARRALRDSHVALALLDSGDLAGASAALPPEDPLVPREGQLWREVARARLAHAEGSLPADIVDRVSRVLDGAPAGPLMVWEGRPLAYAAGWLAPDAPGTAAALLRARFLDTPPMGGTRALLVAGSPFGLAVHLPTGIACRLGVARSTLLSVVSDLREAVVLGRRFGAAADVLRGLLSLPPGTFTGRLVVASDGALDGVPWPVVLGFPGAGAPPASVTEATGRGAALAPGPTSREVVSLADSTGDLPWSRRDSEEAPDARRLVGREATRAALIAASAAGVLHLGVHVRRDAGVPLLQLADGLLGAAEIGEMRFTGRPLVFLAGCASAAEPRQCGVERSLAEAFLAAGASAVVATRWPLADAEAHAVFRPLLAADPRANVEATVARVACALRERGLPPRVWAAPAVFRA